MPGEVVVPTRMVSSGAVDHLRGSLPGFAAGGLVGGYHGNVAGLVPWSRGDLNATVGIFEHSIARATLAGMKAAAVPHPGLAYQAPAGVPRRRTRRWRAGCTPPS